MNATLNKDLSLFGLSFPFMQSGEAITVVPFKVTEDAAPSPGYLEIVSGPWRGIVVPVSVVTIEQEKTNDPV